jgi:hypothetical protein
MKIWTVLVEDDDGHISDTWCFTNVVEASNFRTYVNEQSNTGLSAYIACKNWLFQNGQSAIDDFVESHGE